MYDMNKIKGFAVLAALLSLTVGTLVMTGCNTVEGLGDDLKGASKSTKKAVTGNDSNDSNDNSKKDSK